VSAPTSTPTSTNRRLAGLSREQRALLFEQIRKRKESAGAAPAGIPRRPPELDPVPASFAQERLWFMDRLAPGNAVYNIPMALRIDGEVAPAVLEAVLGEVVRRHEALRTTFREAGGQPVQVIAPPARWSLPLVDLSVLPEDLREAETRLLALEDAVRPFDLEAGPLLHATLLRLEPTPAASSVLLLNLHHIVSDGWSMGVLVREITALYGAAASGRPSPLPELPLQYADFAVWQRGWLREEVLERQLAYWRERLAGVPVSLDLPADRPRPAAPTYRGARLHSTLGLDLKEGLIQLARRHEASLYMVLLAGFQALLGRLTGQVDFSVGSPIANRHRPEIEPLIGFFVNSLVMRGDLKDDPSFREILAQARKSTLEAFAHQDLPFERLVEELQPERHLSVTPLFQAVLALQNAPVDHLDLPGLSLSTLELEATTAENDLELHVWERADSLLAVLAYSTELFDAPTILRIAGHLETLLRGALADPGRRLSELPLLSEPERAQLLREWNDTRADLVDVPLHRLVEEWAAAQPDAPAVLSAAGEKLTYGELDARAGRLARRLRDRGVDRESRVVIAARRSPELIVGMLAVLKAGGAYVPVDPRYPAERVSLILEDSGAVARLGDGDLAAAPGPALARSEEIDPADPANTAYVIYTSGSTGTPKGVMVSHRSISRYVRSMAETYRLTPDDRLLQFASIGFDTSVEEIWCSLASGAALVLRSEEAVGSIPGFLGEVERLEITVLSLTTAYWHELAAALGEEGLSLPARVRLVVIGGEEAQPHRVASWFRSVRRQRGQGRQVELLNTYGPTETTVSATVSGLQGWNEGTPVPIGRPREGTWAYGVDRGLRLVPIGVWGELLIGGDGVARGYLNRPDLTAERFVPDPWSGEPGARLYRSGDLVRFRPDGELQFGGRIDQQVKIRGFRIEPGEIESALLRHPQVREAVVEPRKGAGGGSRLVAWVVHRPEPAAVSADKHELVAQWRTLYDESYVRDEAADTTFDIEGWNSSYTGQAIPAVEMREWVERTVERILSLRPRRVVEIGCGTGLLLFRVAPATERYLGTDFSRVALEGIRRLLARGGLPQVELRQAEADDWEEIWRTIAPGEADLVILNSVSQYFPGADYLARVLEGAVRTVAPGGGSVFIGDVRSLPLLEAFATSVERFQSPDLPPEELRRRVRRRVMDEEELVVDPAFFFALARRLPAIRRVSVLLKRGRWHNELTRYRYDVVLHAGETATVPLPLVDGSGFSLGDVERLLGSQAVAIGGLIDARVTEEGIGIEGIDPEDLWELAERHGHEAELSVDPDAPGRFRALLKRRGSAELFTIAAPDVPDLPWSAFANDPLRSKLAHRLGAELRRALQAEMPDYMVPSAFVVLDVLPLTPNGKVDRAALPEPEPPRSAASTPPRTPAEQALAALWKDVLGIEEVGLEDNFFALGGHSLLATQLVSRVRDAFGVELPLRVVFEAPTVAGLAAWVEEAERSSGPALKPVPRGRPLPLSFAQERLWFMHRLAPESPVYNMPSAVRLVGWLDPGALAAALSGILRRHEALRTTFRSTPEGAVQEIQPWEPVPLPRVDLSVLPEEPRRGEARRIAEEEGRRPFDLERGPLLRALLLRLADGEHALLWTTHHIASDGWSQSTVFIPELVKLSTGSPLPDLPVQYADYAVWQREQLRGPALEDQLGYWRKQLAGLDPLELPADRPRPPVPSGRGGVRLWHLPAGPLEGLSRLAREGDATLFMALFAAFAAVLHRQTGQTAVPVGMPVAGRSRSELEGLIGFFVNTLILRGDLAGNPDFAVLLARSREAVLGALSHQDLPFEKLVDELALPRNPHRPPLLRAVFQLQNAPPGQGLELPGLTLAPFEADVETARFDLSVLLFEGMDGVGGAFRYDADLFDPTTVERLAGHFTTLLQGWIDEPGRPLADLPLLGDGERHQLLVEWNPGMTAEDRGRRCLHRAFEEQVDRTPDAIAVAVSADGGTFTYRELDQWANRLARRLRAAGAGPGKRVALQLDRSAGLVAAILAVLKTGAAYVPIDLNYPAERVAFVLEDSGAALVVGEGDLDASGESADRLDLPADPDLPAYVIYTSGSTGRPKGVVVTHASVARLFTATAPWFGFGPDDVWTLFHSYAFDFSVWELWGALLHGGRLVVVPFWESRDPEAFYRRLRDERVTVLNQTPSAFRQLLWAEEAVLDGAPPDRSPGSALRWVIFGGEALEPASLAPWFARHGDERPRLVNMYGITETTVHVTFRPVGMEDLTRGSVLGQPIPDLTLHVLDPFSRPQPVGVPGEIHVGGAGLAQGYLGRPDLTAERFVPDPFSGPFSGQLGARLYRSGDLARRLPDGDLEYLGRIDHQVKIRGFRVELGEIEAALTVQPGVREAVVLAREDRLVAYIVGDAADPAVLRESLARRLPDPMLPSAFVLLDALPLTENGKVDRRALPAPEAVVRRQQHEPPRTDLERFLASQFRDVLGLPADREVGRHDDFFELGGTSITGAIFIHRLQEALGEIVHVVTIFDHPTVASLAGYVREQHGGKGEAPGTVGTLSVNEVREMDRLIAAGRPQPLAQSGEPINPPALFVLAPPRSGTTLLRVMLGVHPRLFAPPELELLSFQTLAERRAAFQGRDSFWLEGLIRAVMEARGVDAAEAARILEERERQGWTTRRFYGELQGWLEGRMLVDKTPSYALDPEVLRRAEEGFAGARYLHLVRHPQATNRSFEEAKLDQIFFRRPHPFSRRQLAELAWTVSHRNILGFLEGVPRERWLTVRFEELVREPERVLSGICGFLGLPYHPEMAEPYREGAARMVDGPHQASRMLGDVKFLGHGRVDPAAAERWRYLGEPGEPPLGEPAREIAKALGYLDVLPGRPVLVPLTPQKLGAPDRPPLFCIHPVGGEVVAYRDLARRLGPAQPVYGLQSPDPPLEDLRRMAARYLEALREVQPEGPYRLAGWSMGGVVAYEMARQLTERGAERGAQVDLLVLIDAAPPDRWAVEPEPNEVERVALFAADLARLHGVGIPDVDLSGLDEEGALALVLDLGRQAGLLPPTVELAEFRRLFERFRANRRSLTTYEPQPLSGEIGEAVLFRAASSAAADWSPWLKLNLQVFDLPGDHYTLLREDAETLADHLRPLLQGAGRSVARASEPGGPPEAA
jgi:amino acid adenylation domain-containing protein